MTTAIPVLYLLIVLSVANAGARLGHQSAGVPLSNVRTLIANAPKEIRSATDAGAYEEVLAVLGQSNEQYAGDNDAALQAERLRAYCYDRLARYPEKHLAMRRCAELMANGNQGRSAAILLSQTDQVLKKKEICEALVLYGMIASEYPDTPAAPEAYLRIGRTLRVRRDRDGAISAFKMIFRDYPQSRLAQAACTEMSDLMNGVQKYDTEHVEVLRFMLSKYPRNARSEDFRFRLCMAYRSLGDESKFREGMRAYLDRHPEGRYAGIIASLSK